MTTTKTIDTKVTDSPRPNHVAATVDVDGVRFGQVALRGAWFIATRRSGDSRDIRLMSKFRRLDRAVAFVEAGAGA